MTSNTETLIETSQETETADVYPEDPSVSEAISRIYPGFFN